MLTTSLIYDRQPNRSAPSSRSSACSHVTKSPVAHPLSIRQVTKCSSRNSFVLKTIHFNGGGCTGVYPPGPRSSSPRLPIPYSPSPIPFLFTFFRTALHFFARMQNATPFLSSDSALFAKNSGGGDLGKGYFVAGIGPGFTGSDSPRKGSLNLWEISGQNSRSTSKPMS